MNAFAPAAGPRVGALACICPPDAAVGAPPLGIREVAYLGAGATASLLSQAVMFSLLPLAGRMLAPDGRLAALPFLALFVGAVVATFPAALLTDAFGRRAAFGLGASLGVAGGLVVAFGLIHAAFWPLVVGAFWIGTANGFALRYRHAAASGASGDAIRALTIVIGSGALIGFLAPTLAGFAEGKLTPFIGAGSALLAALAHVFALGAALALPQAESDAAIAPAGSTNFRAWLAPTAIAAAAWFGMMAIMAFAPLGLAGCGLAFSATVGAVAWHLVAMYAPALLVGVAVMRLGSGPVAMAGLAMVGFAAVGLAGGPGAAAIVVALLAAGAGWSIATSAAVIALHQSAPSRLMIAAHDAAILAAGLCGAILSGRLF